MSNLHRVLNFAPRLRDGLGLTPLFMPLLSSPSVSMRTIYFDYNTTTPIAASVREAMLPFLGEYFGHPSGNHWIGRAAAEAVEDARSSLAELLNCHPSEIIFTSGGTEGANLALLGVARAISTRTIEPLHLITSVLEHDAVRQSALRLEQLGWEHTVIGCDRNGMIRLDELESAIRPNTRLISIIHASHQLGTIQPISAIAEICVRRDILLHTDAAQTVGKIECEVDHLGVDLLSLSGHKFYAPMGVGALYVRLGVPVEPILFGESSESGLRPGTPNVAHIVGLGQAASLAKSGLMAAIDRVSEHRDRFHADLQRLIGRRIPIHGEAANRLPGTLCIELPGVSAEALQRRLPEICFGPAAPMNGRVRYSSDRSLAAIGLTEQQMANTLRISIGWMTSEDDLQHAVHSIASVYESLLEC